MSSVSQQLLPDFKISMSCPIFNCKYNKNNEISRTFSCCLPGFNWRYSVQNQSHLGFAMRPIEDCANFRKLERYNDDGTICITHGDHYSFISLIPGLGIKLGITTGDSDQIYAVRHSGTFENVLFYEDKVLKWIPKGQMFLPGFAFNFVKLDEPS